MKKIEKEQGFSHIELLIAGTVILVIATIGVYVVAHNKKNTPVASTAATSSTSKQVGTKPSNAAASMSTTASSPGTSSGTIPATKSSSSSSSKSGSPSSAPSPTPSPSPQPSTDPAITITSPTEGQVITGSQYTLSCTHTTPNGYQSAEATIRNNGGTPYISGFSQGASFEACSVVQDASSYPNGNYIITFTVTDNAGKTATATRYFSIQH